MPRAAEVHRKTKETDLHVRLVLDGTGEARVQSGIGFFDHMLEAFARHALIDLTIEGRGDLHVEGHHTVEDTGIAIGQAIAQALGDRAGIRRYADALVPLDEALVRAVVDVSGRPYLSYHVDIPKWQMLGDSSVRWCSMPGSPLTSTWSAATILITSWRRRSRHSPAPWMQQPRSIRG
jgi:imidazoleglycerol phosphate dehydratase HisB